MKTIRYSKDDKEKIVKALKKGGLVAFPTDTVFGLACIMEEKAIKKVYAAKGRSFDKPLPMMCASLNMIKEVAYVNELAEKIAEKFMPGALTLVFKKKDEIPSYVTNGKDSIGIRIPDDDFILGLINDLGLPLMVTSANISGEGSLLNWEDVLEAMDGKIAGIVCEDARGQTASTIIDVSGEEIKMLREGPMSLDAIREALQ
ncbi:MAG: threonylcarbamoyl-AMP synthase [Erysipelotrichaceae bacterium]|nr:threonylcarbamoyl-AMP synthase [Erysipelotrichaceae bacterium]